MEVVLVVSSQSTTSAVLTGSIPPSSIGSRQQSLGSFCRWPEKKKIDEIKKYNAITFYVTSLARCVL